LLLNGVQWYFADTSRDTICPANVVPTSTTSTTTILPVITTTLPLGTTSETTKAPTTSRSTTTSKSTTQTENHSMKNSSIIIEDITTPLSSSTRFTVTNTDGVTVTNTDGITVTNTDGVTVTNTDGEQRLPMPTSVDNEGLTIVFVSFKLCKKNRVQKGVDTQ